MLKKKIGLLGGSFNPVHYAHLMMAERVFEELMLDECYLMPSAIPPHVDTKTTIAAGYRVEMLELAIQDNPHLNIELCEIEKQGKSYSYETIKFLTDKYPDNEYYFIIGADMVEYLPKWYRIDDLIELVKFVGVKRPGYNIETDYPIIEVEVPKMEISSTDIKKRIKQQKSVKYLLPDAVIEYIHTEGLYQNEEQ